MTKKMRVQGESPRIESCTKGGTHVLLRPVQHYCDRCRPDETAKDLARQRRRRARLKGLPAPVAVAASAVPVAPSPPPRPEPPTLKEALKACLREIEQLGAKAQPAIEREIARRAHLGQPLGPAFKRRDDFRDLHQAVRSAVVLADALEA